MGVVHVTHLETGTLTRQTTGTQRRHTALVGNLGKRVGLVHELGQGVRSEKRVDNGRYCLGVDQVDRSEYLIVTNVHALADGT